MRASSIFSQTPRSRHRQKRRCVFFQSPRSGGKSRHGAPVLSIQKTALINNRLSAEGRPTEPLEPGRSFSIFAHTLSEISCLRCAAIWSLLIVSESVFGNSFINNETFQQYACHGYLSHGLRHIKASLVIPHKTPPANQLAECSFNYPTLRHWLKACLPWCAFHDFHNKSKIGGLVHQ